MDDGVSEDEIGVLGGCNEAKVGVQKEFHGIQKFVQPIVSRLLDGFPEGIGMHADGVPASVFRKELLGQLFELSL